MDDDQQQSSPTSDELVALGGWVRILRQARKMSQEQLAEASGVARAIVGRIERGEINFGVLYLWQLARGLGIQVRDLFPESDDPLLRPPG
jgi:transcriptional regulator with XRE-family HTH domain